MFFYVQGPNKHDLMPLERIFDRGIVNEAGAIQSNMAINPEHPLTVTEKHQQKFIAKELYQSIDELGEDKQAIFASQIMSTPAMTLIPSMTVEYALKIFQEKQFRHLPVLSANDKVIGIVSDRDVLQYLAGLHENFNHDPALHKSTDKIELLMQSPILTASEKTDVRYIARLFVARRVGAMPIVSDGELKGIITRSDILHAVMSHYELELWI